MVMAVTMTMTMTKMREDGQGRHVTGIHIHHLHPHRYRDSRCTGTTSAVKHFASHEYSAPIAVTDLLRRRSMDQLPLDYAFGLIRPSFTVDGGQTLSSHW
jgi:hypothetical protein